MTCKNCLHYEAHKHFFKSDDYQKSFDDYFNDKHIEDKCPEFDDRSKWVHLPCNLGDVVYCIDIGDYGKYKVKGLSIDVFGKLRIVVECDVHGYPQIGDCPEMFCGQPFCSQSFSANDFGKTVFFTCEEAEKVLEGKKCIL